MTIKHKICRFSADPGDHFSQKGEPQYSKGGEINWKETGGGRHLRDEARSTPPQIRPAGPVRPPGSPKIFEVMHAAESQVKASGGHRGIVQISFFFKHAQGGFADPQVRCAKNHRPDSRRLFDRLRGPANPVPLLLISGRTKILVLLQSAMGPAMSSQLMASFMTAPHEIGIRLGKTACEEHRSGHVIAIAAIQQCFEPFLRPRYPVAINREVQALCHIEGVACTVEEAGKAAIA